MGCDYWTHRVRTGIFNFSVLKSRKRNRKIKTLNTLHIMLLFLGITSVILVCSISLTEPSRIHGDSNINSSTIGVKTDHRANSTDWSQNSSIDDLILPRSQDKGRNSLWPMFILNDPVFERTVKTSTDLFILKNLIGNKDAHSYFGNTQNAKRTPKYPCTACGKAVTSRSKAVSCDLCDNWTHTKCTGSI